MLDPDILLFLSAAALVAGFIDAIAGGGGLITIPALLTAGIPPAQALATNKLQGTFGSGMATLTFWRAGLIDLRAMVVPVICTALGAACGTALVQVLKPGFLEAVIPVLLVGIALYFLLSPKAGDMPARQIVSLNVFALTVGFGVGFYDGFFGPGTGSFFAIGFVALLGLPIRQATANTKLLNFTSNVVSLGVFAIGGDILWLVGLCMAAGQALGAWAGSNAAIRFGAGLVRPLLVVMCLALTIRLVSAPDHPIQQMVRGWLAGG
ncbi:MAG: hypothetical protein RLY86_2847 [Pseudomonadota bacterium]|jgi:uncharacterized membrane protein YfcA